MSNFINEMKKDSVLKDIHDARIEAIDSSVVENSVNPVEGGAVFTALAGKQDMLTAGTNVSIDSNVISATDTTYSAGNGLSLSNTEFSVDTTVVATQQDLTQGLATKQDTLTAGNNIDITNGVISATDTTYTAGTNIDISNGVISVVGELGVDDYDDLDNKPIINQDLEAVGFTPVANTYYRHTGEGGGLEGFTVGQTLSNGDKIHFDTSKGSELASYLEGLDYLDNSSLFFNTNGEIGMSASDMSVIAGISDCYVLAFGNKQTFEMNVVYATKSGEFNGITWNKGFNNLDSDGAFTLSLTNTCPINQIKDTTPPTWNGIIIGTAAASQYVSGKIYFYDGEEYKAIDGSKGLTSVTASDVNSESATSGQVLTADGEGGASWVDSSSGDVEGTDILSTGETSGKVLSANGDGTSSWVSPAPSGIKEIDLRNLGTWDERGLLNVGGYASFMDTMTEDIINTLRNEYVVRYKFEFYTYKTCVMYKQPILDDNIVYYVGKAVDYTETNQGGKRDDVFILRAVVGGSNKFMSIFHYANTLDLGTISAIPQGTGVNNINRANNMNNILYNPELNIQFNFTGNSKNFWVTAKKQLVDYTTKTAYFVVPNWYKYTLGATNTNTSDLHVSICVASGTYCDIRFNLYSDGLQEVKVSNINSESATSGQVLAADGSGGASWQNASGGGIEPINLKDTALFGTLPTFYINGTNANDGDVDFTGFTENGYNALKNGQIAYLKDTTANYDLTFVKDRVFNRGESDYIVYVAKNFYYPMIKNVFSTGPIDISYILLAKYDGSSYTCKMMTCTNTLYLGSGITIPSATSGVERLDRSVYEYTLMYNPNLKVAFNYTYTYNGTSHNIDCILDRIFVDRQNKVAYFYLPSYYNLSRNDPTGITPGELIVSIGFKSGTYCDIRFNLPNTNSALANNIIPNSTEPSSTNVYYTANGAYRPYICTESNEPATKYNGYIYFITED